VRSYLKNWVAGIVQKYNFDGIRIDTIPEVPGSFWREYGEAAGVFQMGECFNGDPAYVGPYQQDLTALFNYPMYYSIGDVFGSGKSMYDFRNRFNTEENYFSDIDALGIFVDNHDNPRFMNRYNNKAALRAAETFILTARGIPFTYYATEQYYAGGNDPKNRESLWQDYNTNSDLYQMIAKINAQRKHNQIWNEEQIERYVDDQFYSYSRGSMLVALTNQYNGSVNRNVTYLPYNNGDVVCDILSGNCQTVNNGLNVTLNNGYPQIWVLQGDMNTAQETVFLQ
jgi:alpha-amylase